MIEFVARKKLCHDHRFANFLIISYYFFFVGGFRVSSCDSEFSNLARSKSAQERFWDKL
jgi:hypothetical protein